MKPLLILLLIIKPYCEAISEDYYVAVEEEDTETKNKNASLYESGEEHLENLHLKNNTDIFNETNSDTTTENKTIDTTTSTSVSVQYNTTSDQTFTSVNDSELKVTKLSRHDIFKYRVYQYDDATPILDEVKASRRQHYTSRFHPKNLKPIDSYETHSQFLQFNNSVWYVPENLPCWDLPILYGERQRYVTNEVFLTIRGKIDEIIEKEAPVKIAPMRYNVANTKRTNKWCSSEPCYGDHTLCLFGSGLSKLCSKGYRVKPPSIVERIALVNTINSMRNRIASGSSGLYRHLPPAANMKQIIYDFDLQNMARVWLRQCLPGPSPCLSLDENYVRHLECTKTMDYCCIHKSEIVLESKCIPKQECYIDPIIGCIYTWFRSAIDELTETDVKCGHITPITYNTVQLLWAETNKIGCAYAKTARGDVRVVCNFAPGAPFTIDTKLFCGFLKHRLVLEDIDENITSPEFLETVGIVIHPLSFFNFSAVEFVDSKPMNYSSRLSGLDILNKIYRRKWIREKMNYFDNGSMGLIARLVTKYTFGGHSILQCHTNRNIYEAGAPGSMCLVKGGRFHALCYEFREPTPGYRLVAVLAPIALFSLILHDLFSGVVRQTDY